MTNSSGLPVAEAFIKRLRKRITLKSKKFQNCKDVYPCGYFVVLRGAVPRMANIFYDTNVFWELFCIHSEKKISILARFGCWGSKFLITFFIIFEILVFHVVIVILYLISRNKDIKLIWGYFSKTNERILHDLTLSLPLDPFGSVSPSLSWQISRPPLMSRGLGGHPQNGHSSYCEHSKGVLPPFCTPT